MVTCVPYWKVKLWKKGLGDIFANRPRAQLQKNGKSVLFELFLRKGSIFKLRLKKYPRPGPRMQAPMGYFSNSVWKWTLLSINLKTDSCFKILFLKVDPRPNSKLSWFHVFKVSLFDKGRKSLINPIAKDTWQCAFNYVAFDTCKSPVVSRAHRTFLPIPSGSPPIPKR